MATRKTSSKSPPARKTAIKPVKKTLSEATEEANSEPQQLSTDKPVTTTRAFKIKKSYIILAVIVVALATFLYFFRSLFVAAVVNGQPISRLSVVAEAEKQSGKQVMTTLVRNTLIEQEGRKQNITVNDKEIDEEIKKLEGNLQKQGQKLDQVLTIQGMNREDLRKLIRLDKMVGKMVGKDIKITDKQIAEYIEKNKESLPQGQSEKELNASVKEQLKQQELNEKVRVWLEDLQKKAKINRFVGY